MNLHSFSTSAHIFLDKESDMGSGKIGQLAEHMHYVQVWSLSMAWFPEQSLEQPQVAWNGAWVLVGVNVSSPPSRKEKESYLAQPDSTE